MDQDESNRLRMASAEAEELAQNGDIAQILAQLMSDDADVVLIGVMASQTLVQSGGDDDRLFPAAARLLSTSGDSDVRWQSAILMGLYLPCRAEQIWQTVVDLGSSEDGDAREMIATVLLEHLIDYDAARYRPLAEDAAARSSYFQQTLDLCW